MSYEFQSVEALIDGVKGTTGFFSSLISRKSGLVLIFSSFADLTIRAQAEQSR
jgi:hypothetical protein